MPNCQHSEDAYKYTALLQSNTEGGYGSHLRTEEISSLHMQVKFHFGYRSQTVGHTFSHTKEMPALAENRRT